MEQLRALRRGSMFIFDDELYASHGTGRKEGMVAVKQLAVRIDGVWRAILSVAGITQMDGDVWVILATNIGGELAQATKGTSN